VAESDRREPVISSVTGRRLKDLPNMIQPPLLGVVKCRKRSLRPNPDLPCASRAAELLYAVGVHGRTGTPVPQIAAARRERVRCLDTDIARVEREGIAAFDAVLLEGLHKELRHRCIAVVRIEYIDVRRPKPGALAHSPGGRGRPAAACSRQSLPWIDKWDAAVFETADIARDHARPLARTTAAIIRSSGAVGRPALRRAAKMSA